MTKMGVMIVEAWAGGQLLVVSGTAVTIGEGPFEGHSWTMGVVLLVTVEVGLLSCVCPVFDPHLPTGNVHVTREQEVVPQPSGMALRNMRTKIINHAKERTRSLSWFSGDQVWQLVEMNARYCRDTLVQFLRHVASTSENQTRCSCDHRVWAAFFDSVTGSDDYWYDSKL